MENHYVWSKNINLFAPKLACERVITSVACGNRHLCSIFVCLFGVYFQENWKIIFKIRRPKAAKNRPSSHRPNCSLAVLLSEKTSCCMSTECFDVTQIT